MSNHYIVLGVTIADAKSHPAFAGALGAATPRSFAHTGRPITGYVMTDAFSEVFREDSPAGVAARNALSAAKIDLAHGTPVRLIRGSLQSESTWTRS